MGFAACRTCAITLRNWYDHEAIYKIVTKRSILGGVRGLLALTVICLATLSDATFSVEYAGSLLLWSYQGCEVGKHSVELKATRSDRCDQCIQMGIQMGIRVAFRFCGIFLGISPQR
jgi:hypothetical protein